MNLEFLKIQMELHRVTAGKIEQEIRIAEREQEIERIRASLVASDQKIAELEAKLKEM